MEVMVALRLTVYALLAVFGIAFVFSAFAVGIGALTVLLYRVGIKKTGPCCHKNQSLTD